MRVSRRGFLRSCVAASALHGLAVPAGAAMVQRRYEVCLSPDALDAYPDILDIVANAGISRIWIPAFIHGYWPYPTEQRHRFRDRIKDKRMEAAAINVPLGHPGDSLGSMDGNVPLTPPDAWRMGVRADGRLFSGTSLHPPATEENASAVRALAREGDRRVFLDDDFRLAISPGMIGGCFCDAHKQAFLESRGFTESHWEELLAAVLARRVCATLREWITFTCDELTASFRTQQAAAPEIVLGNMIMYFGAEKAGIRLSDYADTPFRVGELMFNDASFAPVKSKTDELYSALFHRRYAQPELAYSETTAYPANQLSASNMAAKLAVSTIADVRTTMFMSGLTPFPLSHWDTLAPAMRHNAKLHSEIAGHPLRGPLKHYWGEYSRLVGDDVPYSLFLAMGIPFEVCDAPADNGYIFLSDADAQAVHEGALKPDGARYIARRHDSDPSAMWSVAETLDALFALKQRLLPELHETPYVVEDTPMVCAWYPSANKALLWNLQEREAHVTLRYRGEDRAIALGALDIQIVEV